VELEGKKAFSLIYGFICAFLVYILLCVIFLYFL